MIPYIAVMHFGIWLLIFLRKEQYRRKLVLSEKLVKCLRIFLMGEQRKLFKVEGIRRFMKLFSGADLIIYFFIYGLLAWILNTVIYSLKEQRYINTV